MAEAITGVPAANASVRTMPKLSPASEGAQRTSASWSSCQSRSRRHAAADVDVVQCLPIRQIAEDVGALGADHGQAARHVLDESAECCQQDRQPLALLGAADEQDPQLLAARLLAIRGSIDVDAVGDDLVAAAEPAPAGPGRRLGDGDPRREAVEDAPGAEREAMWLGTGLVE